MSLSSPFFCDTCGAANRLQAQFCRACGQSLHATQTSFSNTLTGLLAPQVMLKQRYILHGPAGRGGFGAVYKASDTQFGHRLVAIKEMSQNSLEPREVQAAVESFKHEALLLAGLNHANLPHIYEQFMENGRSYLVMDFIEGETLEEQLNKLTERKLPLETVFDIAQQLCAVLEYLHTRQPPIVFRDLKPANIMLTPNGHLYLIDFGIARHFKPGQEKDTTALGSTGYAPPEQYGKSQTTLRADIYSLGATLHQLLTGDDPSESPFHFAPLHFTEPTLAGLGKLIMSMVNVNVNERPASIVHVQQEMQRIATQYKLGEIATEVPSSPNTLPPLPARTLPAGYYQQPATAPPGPRKRGPKQVSQPQVYPQANTIYICLGHSSRITSVAWSPDGQQLASASYDKTVQLWNGVNGSHIRTYTAHKARVNSLVWSPDGKLIASASDDRSVHLWEAATGKTLFIYYGHSAPLHSVAWSPDGKFIATAGDDKTVQVWDAKTHAILKTYSEHADKIYALTWSPDSKYLASAGKDHTLRIREPLPLQQKRSFLSNLFSPRTGAKTFKGLNGAIYALAWAPDGKHIASVSGDYKVQIRDIQTGMLTYSLATDSATLKNTAAWSPTGKHLAIGGNDKLVRLWNVANRKEIFAYYGHTGYVMTVAWSPDGTRIASAGVDRTIQVWQAV